MDVSDVERLVELVQRSRVSELTLRTGDTRVTIRKPVPESAALITVDGGPPGLADSSDESGSETDSGARNEECPVTAHLVGTYHHVRPPIGLGARVKAGQVIGIIDAMKITNDLTAPVAGVVVDVLIEDGLPVEYGQTLFLLRPDE